MTVNLWVFRDAYLPKRLIARDSQMKAIKEVVKVFNESQHGWSLILIGGTGTGKTATAKVLIERNKNTFLYASGSTSNTTLRLLKQLVSPASLRTYSECVQRLIRTLKEAPRILFIDEADKVKNLFELGNALNAIYRETSCPIFLITRKRFLLKEFADDAYHTLKFSRVEFPDYDYDELEKILEWRLKESNLKLNKGVFGRIIGFGINEGGGARDMLDLTYRVGVSKGKTIEDVEAHIQLMQHDEWQRYIQKLPFVKRTFLSHAVKIAASNGGIVKPGQLQTKSTKSPSHTSQLLGEFTNQGIMVRHIGKNKGRGGGADSYYTFEKNALKQFKEQFNDLDGGVNY